MAKKKIPKLKNKKPVGKELPESSLNTFNTFLENNPEMSKKLYDMRKRIGGPISKPTATKVSKKKEKKEENKEEKEKNVLEELKDSFILKKVPSEREPKQGDSLVTVMAKLLNYLNKKNKEEKLQKEIDANFEKDKQLDEEKRHKDLMNALKGAFGNKKQKKEKEGSGFLAGILSFLSMFGKKILSFVGKALLKGLKFIAKNLFEGLKFIIKNLFKGLKVLAEKIYKALKFVFEKLGKLLSEAFTFLKKSFGELVEFLKGLPAKIGEFFSKATEWAEKAIKSLYEKFIKPTIEALEKAATKITKFIEPAIKLVKETIQEMLEKLSKILGKGFELASNAAKSLFKGAGKVAGIAGEAAAGAAGGALKAAKGISSFLGKIAKIGGGIAGKSLPFIGPAIVAAFEINKAIKEHEEGKLDEKGLKKRVASAVGGAIGGVGGWELGAIIGSTVGPVGTILGGLGGAFAGEYLGRKAGEALFDFMSKQDDPESIQPKNVKQTAMKEEAPKIPKGGTFGGAGATGSFDKQPDAVQVKKSDVPSATTMQNANQNSADSKVSTEVGAPKPTNTPVKKDDAAVVPKSLPNILKKEKEEPTSKGLLSAEKEKTTQVNSNKPKLTPMIKSDVKSEQLTKATQENKNLELEQLMQSMGVTSPESNKPIIINNGSAKIMKDRDPGVKKIPSVRPTDSSFYEAFDESAFRLFTT